MPARKNVKSKTPQPARPGRTPQLPSQKKTPKSAPAPKRTMKLVEDEDKKTPKKVPIRQMQFEEEDDDYMSDEDLDMAGMDDSDEDMDDNSEEEEDQDADLELPQAGRKRKQPAKEIPTKQTPAKMQQQAKKLSGAATPTAASKMSATLKPAKNAAATPTPKAASKAIQGGQNGSQTPKLACTPGKGLAEREIRTLFIKNLPMNVTEKDIKALSPDILSVRIRVALRKKMKSKAFAFLEFASEKLAEKNFAQLKDKKVLENKIHVDYCGEKSSYKKSKKSVPFTGEMDPLRLYISGFPLDTKLEELQRLMPKAVQLDLPKRKRIFGFAFAKFAEAKDAAAALQKHNGTLFKEQVLIVDQARKRPEPAPQAGDKRKAPDSKANKGPKAKKAKVPAKEEDDDEDEEDDDEDEEDDDDDDEEEDNEDEEDDDEDEEDDDEDEEEDDEDEEDDDEEEEDDDEEEEEDEEDDSEDEAGD